MQFIYVLLSQKDGNWYIGCTHDVDGRLKLHNSGRVQSTKSRRPFVLLYKEEYEDYYQAFKMEKYYKTAKGKRELKAKIYSGIV